MSSSEYVVIYVTVPNREVGLKIAKELVKSGLVACVNIVPNITSVYMWKGKVEIDSEELMIMKTRKELLKDVERVVKELHPYEVPEVIATELVWGSEEYLKWVDEVVKGSK